MGIKLVCVCDLCFGTIVTPDDGVIIQGNVYAADPEKLGGIIGNNFPDSEDGIIHMKNIRKSVLCNNCLRKTLFPTNPGSVNR